VKRLLSWIIKLWPTVLVGAKKGVAVVATGIVWLWARVKAVKWTPGKVEIVRTGLLLTAMVVIVILAKHQQQPAAMVAKVTVKKVVENPAPKQTKAADVVITKQTTVKASGTVKIKPKVAATAKESEIVGIPLAETTEETKMTVSIPLTGTATTTYIDDQTGQAVGQGTHAVTGQANVTVQDDTVTADVTIDDTSQVAVTIKHIKRKNEFGGYGGVAVCSDPYTFIGGYYQRNFLTMQIKKADMALFARVSVEKHWGADEDWEGRLTIGVRVEW
jgi:hypothetical protein